MLSHERRKARSQNRAEAVRLYLEANGERAGIQACALSDDSGLLISGMGSTDLEILAAVGPLFVSGGPVSPAMEAQIDEVVKNHDVYASALEVAGARFVLTSLGARFPEQRRAERAFARILGE